MIINRHLKTQETKRENQSVTRDYLRYVPCFLGTVSNSVVSKATPVQFLLFLVDRAGDRPSELLQLVTSST